MNRATEWFISGALTFGMLVFLFLIGSRASDNAFWFGADSVPPFQRAVMNLSPILFPILVIFGIVCLGMGLKNAGVITVEKESMSKPTNAPTTFTTSNMPREFIAKEVVMIPCERCNSLMPQTSTFCPSCGSRRN